MFSFLYHCQDFYRTWLYTRVTRRMSCKKHKLLTIRKHLTTWLQPCFWWGPCYVFAFVCFRHMYHILPVSLDYPFLIARSVFFNVYLVLSEYATIILHPFFFGGGKCGYKSNYFYATVPRNMKWMYTIFLWTVPPWKHKILLWTIPLMTFGTYLRRRYGSFPAFHADDVYIRDSRGRHRMVVGFTTTCAISAYHH